MSGGVENRIFLLNLQALVSCMAVNQQFRKFKRIGVLSDTHLTDIGECANLAQALLEGPFRDVDAILHAGDHVCAELESCFYPVPWLAVRGNMDSGALGLPQYRLLNINGCRVGIVHGWGYIDDLEERIVLLFKDFQPDVIVYGHSHYPVCHKVGQTLLFNPGSPTDKRRADFPTVGLLEFGATITGRHIQI